MAQCGFIGYDKVEKELIEGNATLTFYPKYGTWWVGNQMVKVNTAKMMMGVVNEVSSTENKVEYKIKPDFAAMRKAVLNKKQLNKR